MKTRLYWLAADLKRNARIGFCVCMAVLFNGAAIGFFACAIHFWVSPPWWEVQLRANPEFAYLTRGDVPLLFMLGCAPLGFGVIWSARLWMAIKKRP